MVLSRLSGARCCRSVQVPANRLGFRRLQRSTAADRPSGRRAGGCRRGSLPPAPVWVLGDGCRSWHPGYGLGEASASRLLRVCSSEECVALGCAAWGCFLGDASWILLPLVRLVEMYREKCFKTETSLLRPGPFGPRLTIAQTRITPGRALSGHGLSFTVMIPA